MGAVRSARVMPARRRVPASQRGVRRGQVLRAAVDRCRVVLVDDIHEGLAGFLGSELDGIHDMKTRLDAGKVLDLRTVQCSSCSEFALRIGLRNKQTFDGARQKV